jgi:monoamine oxidase
MQRIETDVCVVGAGFAGLTAALRCSQAGRSVVVLEARDRVGGRAHTEWLADGTPVEHGGSWFGPGHDAALGLAAEFGVRTARTYDEGKSVFVKRGKARTYKGTIPTNAGIPALANLGVAFWRLDRMARKVPVDAPWDAPRAARWDRTTVRQWICRNVPPGLGRRMLESSLADLHTADSAEVSLLAILHLINAHGGLTPLMSIEGGAQENRVVGGMQGLAEKVAAKLGDGLRLGSPVELVRVVPGGVEVTADDTVVAARRVVVAIPATLVPTIRFDPALPSDRAALYQHMPMGALTKFSLVYDEPFWRRRGMSGVSVDLDAQATITLDGCDEEARVGVLMAISAGPAAEALARLSPDERRRRVVDSMVTRFGPEAARPREVLEQPWAAEEYSRGGSLAHHVPGSLTQYGRLLREPHGPVHWAGTETATVSHGAIDGAIRSGERAAGEVLAA